MKSRLYPILLCCFLLSFQTVWAGSLAKLIKPNLSCLQYQIVGLCIRPFSIKLRVRHWIPALLIEVTKGPGDSVLSRGGNPATGTRVKQNLENAYSVRIWRVPGFVLKLALKKACMSCNVSDVEGPPPANMEEVASLAMTKLKVPACGSDELIQKALNLLRNKLSLGQAVLLYSTEIDAINWRTGCRDQLIAAKLAPYGPLCTVSGMMQNLSGLAGMKMSPILAGKQFCVGSWGLLMPRQMRSFSTEVNGAAFAAYRALHIARFNLWSVQVPVMLSGKFQQVYPAPSQCFHPGETSILNFRKRLTVSPDGRYAFLWWVPVTCCIGFGGLDKCATSFF